MNQGENAPPLHPRCRCTIVATFDTPKSRSKPVGERSARETGDRRERAPADMTYRDWKAIYIDKSKTLAEWRSAKDAKYGGSGLNSDPSQGKIQSRRLSTNAPISRTNKMISASNEHAVVQDNGLRNGYMINFNLMNIKAYHDRFENLTKSKAVNEELYRQAIKILGRRSGTEYEDLVIINARTGKFILENTSAAGMRKFQCSLSQAQFDELEARGEKFEALHNHPNNSFPSLADIKILFKRKLQRGSTVVCHNGTVYRMEKLKDFEAIEEIASNVLKETAEDLLGCPADMIETRASKKIISLLERAKALKFKEVPSREKRK